MQNADDNAQAIAIPRVFSDNSWSKKWLYHTIPTSNKPAGDKLWKNCITNILVTRIFSFSNNVLFIMKDKYHVLSQLLLLACKCSIWTRRKCCLVKSESQQSVVIYKMQNRVPGTFSLLKFFTRKKKKILNGDNARYKNCLYFLVFKRFPRATKTWNCEAKINLQKVWEWSK